MHSHNSQSSIAFGIASNCNCNYGRVRANRVCEQLFSATFMPVFKPARRQFLSFFLIFTSSASSLPDCIISRPESINELVLLSRWVFFLFHCKTIEFIPSPVGFMDVSRYHVRDSRARPLIIFYLLTYTLIYCPHLRVAGYCTPISVRRKNRCVGGAQVR